MAVTPQYFVILVVDIERFGARPNPVQTFLRRSLYELLESALEEAGIDHRGGARPVDRGDGLFLLLPGSVPKTDLVGLFVARLRTGLRAHAQTSSDAAALRLRVVLHSGEVAWDGRGWVGEDLNTACRMVDHQPLRDTLAAAGDAQLVLGISDGWHRSVLRHDYPQLDTAAFRPVRFDAKEIQDETVWVLVPGYPAPPGLEHAGTAEPAAAGHPVRHAAAARSANGAAPPAAAPPTTAPPTTAPPTTAAPTTAAQHPSWRPEMPTASPDSPDEPYSVSVSQTGGGTQQAVGINHGYVSQSGAGSAGPAPDPVLLAHITTLRRALRDARQHSEVDADTFEGASRALDEAAREAAAGPAGRSRFVLALRSFRGLVEPVTALAAAAAAVIASVRGNGS
ncbi:hypothetical protein V2S66_19605 [Streptomyces sp. V4-01]|uniref:Guanylate cyclase domain-containing protein n=1 Tax=Actinacidiphila polyblastidii TaxID=3110430 RepID=A0ABU7PEF1_9ACTN|nr:hypothetical protein [Streptomyces sp. V4-01]